MTKSEEGSIFCRSDDKSVLPKTVQETISAEKWFPWISCISCHFLQFHVVAFIFPSVSSRFNIVVLHVLLISEISFSFFSFAFYKFSSMFFWILQLFWHKQWKMVLRMKNQWKSCFKSERRVMALNFHWFPTMLSSFGFRVLSLPFKHRQKPREMKGTSSKHHCFTRFSFFECNCL